jgi:hypothetical protein
MYNIYIMNYKIYKLTNDEGLNYIGSTNIDLDKRFSNHKSLFKRYVNNKIDLYCTAFEVLKGTNPRIECIEELENLTKLEARTIEDNYISDLECVNKNKAIITPEETKQKVNAYNRKYYANHKDYWKTEEFKQKQKQYYQANKARIIERVKNKYKSKKNKE